MVEKLLVLFFLITSEVLKLEGVENLSEVNSLLMTNLWKEKVLANGYSVVSFVFHDG